MESIASNTPLSINSGTTLALFLGATKEDQFNGLLAVKDALTDVFMACLTQDCLLNENTQVQLQSLYIYADSQIKGLARDKAFI